METTVYTITNVLTKKEGERESSLCGHYIVLLALFSKTGKLVSHLIACNRFFLK